MCTARVLMTGVLAVGLVAILSCYGLAAGQSGAAAQTEFSPRPAMPPAPYPTESGGPTLKRASRLMHARVRNPQGQALGRVYDIVLTPDLNGVSYVALSRGGIFGIGQNLYSIPWSVVSMGLDNTLTVSVSEQQLGQTRGFRPGHWPSTPETCWLIPRTQAGQQPLGAEPTRQESQGVQDRRFSKIRGLLVRGPQEQRVGKITDIVVAIDNGQIPYTIVSYGGLLGLGQRYTAVPESAITVEPSRNIAKVNVSTATLHAQSFRPNQFPDLSAPEYAQQLAQAYGLQPNWTALGYVAPAPSTPSPAQPSAAPPMPAAPRERETAPSAPSSKMAEPAAAELIGTFDPANISTVRGTVIDEGKFTITPTGPALLWLTIRTDNGRTVNANLGPRDYISSQDFYVVKGDQIRLKGSDVAATTPGARVFLPTEVSYGDHVLRLRNESGTPLWEEPVTAPPSAAEVRAPSIQPTPTQGTHPRWK
jgi:sporulation protein YlmC with PRC-barrel domain